MRFIFRLHLVCPIFHFLLRRSLGLNILWYLRLEINNSIAAAETLLATTLHSKLLFTTTSDLLVLRNCQETVKSNHSCFSRTHARTPTNGTQEPAIEQAGETLRRWHSSTMESSSKQRLIEVFRHAQFEVPFAAITVPATWSVISIVSTGTLVKLPAGWEC